MAVLPAQTVKRLAKELTELQGQPCEGIRVFINEADLTDIQAEIDGPMSTPYEGGVFRMRLCLGSDFPEAPPKGYFMTKIFHPNVSKSGDICVNVLKRDWTPEMGLRHVLLIVRCLLIDPNPESALNEEAGKLLLEDYNEYASHAKLMTSIHAMPAKRPMPLTTSTSNTTNCPPSSRDSGSPAMKKSKPEKKLGAASKVKKNLKRL
jgi:ubiquitin-conjugating enzyme E2 S